MTDIAIHPHRSSATASHRAEGPAAHTATPASFQDALRRVTSAPPSDAAERILHDASASIERGERLLNGVIRAAERGRSFTNEELIAVQAGVYRYTQELELAGKLVDKLTSAVRQTVQSQQ